jgi:hypothetical protein
MRLGGQLQFVAFSEMKHAPSKMGEQRSKPPSWCVCIYIYIYPCVCVLRWVMIGVGCLEHSGFP